MFLNMMHYFTLQTSKETSFEILYLPSKYIVIALNVLGVTERGGGGGIPHPLAATKDEKKLSLERVDMYPISRNALISFVSLKPLWSLQTKHTFPKVSKTT